jgi:hypothetical protein
MVQLWDVNANSRLTHERVRIINEVNSNDSIYIRILKESFEYLRNHNKKEN